MLGPRALAVTAAGALLLSATLVAGASAAGGSTAAGAAGGGTTSGDFDGDGYDDLAVGAPGETVGTVRSAGNVTVAFGGPAGVDTDRTQVVRPGLAGLGTSPGVEDRFGSSLAVGDFDGDGFDDLAAGAPGDDVQTTQGVGSVGVVFGSPSGLAAGRAVTLRQGRAPVAGTPEEGDQFGAAVAAGDVDGDGYDDLAVGAPQEAVGTTVGVGNVTVVFGGPSGFTRSTIVRQGLDGLTGTGFRGDSFGSAVAVGDVDGDGHGDLAVGAPWDAASEWDRPGSVTVVPGSPNGLDPDRGWAVGHVLQDGSGFGAAVAAGDLDADGDDDLAVGAPDWRAGFSSSAGAVTVALGGPTSHPTVTYEQSDLGFAVESGDQFGAAVAIAPLGAGQPAALVAGSPGEDIGATEVAGAAVVVRHLLFEPDARLVQQGALAGATETGDAFGSSLAVGDFDADGQGDLVFGARAERVGDVEFAGNVTVLTGAGGAAAYNQGTLGGAVEPFDGFGWSVA